MLSDFEDSTQRREIDATRATARLPGLDIEIVHRRSPGGDTEQISINLQAVPSFEAFGRFVESANPFAFWARAVQMAWLPPGLTLPRVGRAPTSQSAERPGESK